MTKSLKVSTYLNSFLTSSHRVPRINSELNLKKKLWSEHPLLLAEQPAIFHDNMKSTS